MMKLILVSATSFEIDSTIQFLRSFSSRNLLVDVYITGVGMVNTAFELGKLVDKKYNFAINAGIAGSFGNNNIGEVVKVTQDCFCELGAENKNEFLSINELGLGEQELKLSQTLELNSTKKLFHALGVTVNTVHGNENSIQTLLQRKKADVETMEGAAFIHAANAFNWKATQIRSISNKVENRNRDAWDIPLAIKNLNIVLINCINELNEQ